MTREVRSRLLFRSFGWCADEWEIEETYDAVAYWFFASIC